MSAVDVHGLPARWRKEADAIREQSGYTGDMQFDYCADELEAALRQSGEAVADALVNTAPPATSGLVELVRREIEAAKRELDTVTATDDAQSDGIGCAENALDRALAAIAAIAGHDAGGGR